MAAYVKNTASIWRYSPRCGTWGAPGGCSGPYTPGAGTRPWAAGYPCSGRGWLSAGRSASRSPVAWPTRGDGLSPGRHWSTLAARCCRRNRLWRGRRGTRACGSTGLRSPSRCRSRHRAGAGNSRRPLAVGAEFGGVSAGRRQPDSRGRVSGAPPAPRHWDSASLYIPGNPAHPWLLLYKYDIYYYFGLS